MKYNVPNTLSTRISKTGLNNAFEGLTILSVDVMGWLLRLVTKERGNHCSFDRASPLLLPNPTQGGLNTQLQIQFWGLQDLNFVLSIHSNLDAPSFKAHTLRDLSNNMCSLSWPDLKWVSLSLDCLTRILLDLKIPRLRLIIWFEKWQIKRPGEGEAGGLFWLADSYQISSRRFFTVFGDAPKYPN